MTMNEELSISNQYQLQFDDKSQNVVLVKAITWRRDSHGLFDQESRHVQKKSLKTQNSGWFVRNSDDDIVFKKNVALDEIQQDNKTFLAKIGEADGTYMLRGLDQLSSLPAEQLANEVEEAETTLVSKMGEDSLEKCWLVVRSLNRSSLEQGQHLCVGDILKLGRVKFKIRESMHEGEKKLCSHLEPEYQKTAIANVAESLSEENGVYENEFECRICFSSEFTDDNPLVNICACAGSIKFLHVGCLRDWLKSKLNTRSSANSTSYFWKNFECELCKQPYPNFLQFTVHEKQTSLELISIERPEAENYLVLEAIAKDRRNSGGVHIITLSRNKNSIKLGRGSDSDIRISDISVSRCHAIVSLRSGGYFVEDNTSKFGTLVRVNKPLPLKVQQTIAVQIGRTVLSFNVRISQSLTLSDGQQRLKDISKIKPEHRTTTDNIMFYQKHKHHDDDLMGSSPDDDVRNTHPLLPSAQLTTFQLPSAATHTEQHFEQLHDSEQVDHYLYEHDDHPIQIHNHHLESNTNNNDNENEQMEQMEQMDEMEHMNAIEPTNLPDVMSNQEQASQPISSHQNIDDNMVDQSESVQAIDNDNDPNDRMSDQEQTQNIITPEN